MEGGEGRNGKWKRIIEKGNREGREVSEAWEGGGGGQKGREKGEEDREGGRRIGKKIGKGVKKGRSECSEDREAAGKGEC